MGKIDELELMTSMVELTKETIEMTKDLQASRDKYTRNLTYIVIAIITSFTIILVTFYSLYFTSDYSAEIEARNTNKNINENYNYNLDAKGGKE